MAAEVKLDLNFRELQIRIKKAEAEILDDTADRAAGLTVVNIIANDSVDTGFMVNSVHALHTNSSGVAAETAQLPNKDGSTVTRRSAPLPATDGHTSAVGIGAEYGIFPELEKPALLPAAQQLADEMDTIVTRVGRKHF